MKIRIIRRVKGVTEMARATGYSTTHISAVLRGERRSLSCLRRLAEAGYELPPRLARQLAN